MKFRKTEALKGEVTIPGDKSISHRAVMLGAISRGTTRITNFLRGADCLSTSACFRKMGISIEEFPEEIVVHGNGTPRPPMRRQIFWTWATAEPRQDSSPAYWPDSPLRAH